MNLLLILMKECAVIVLVASALKLVQLLFFYCCFYYLSFSDLTPDITATYKGKTYTLLTTSQSWSSGKEACADLGGHLVVITDEEEQNFIINMIRQSPNRQGVWIGLYRTTNQRADFKWIDGSTPFEFKNPSFYQPWISGDNNGGKQKCVRLREDDGYRWADHDCSKSFWVSCEEILPRTDTSRSTSEQMFSMYTGPGISLSYLRSMTIDSVDDCLVVCTQEINCAGAQMMKRTGAFLCEIYNKPDGDTVSLETKIYVKQFNDN